MKYFLLICFSLFIDIIHSQDTTIINKSRKATVKIIAYNNKNYLHYGTGFFVKSSGQIFVLTCLHVIDTNIIQKEKVMAATLTNIKCITWSGDTIDLIFATINKGIIPADYMKYDYSILKSNVPLQKYNIETLSLERKKSFVGENIYFSGYPFGFPSMLTHTGVLSGFDNDSSCIYLQSSINEGNSGGALLNSNGNVIGIIDFKITGIPNSFNEYKKDLQQTINEGNNLSMYTYNSSGKRVNSSSIMSNLQLASIIETSINTGIGGAINIKYAFK